MSRFYFSNNYYTMKVAVLLIGNMRTYNITSKYLIKYLLQPYDCDLFITTYDKRFNFISQCSDDKIDEQHIRSLYGKYLKNMTIINQHDFFSHYEHICGKYYSHQIELDRYFTIEKLLFVAYEKFNTFINDNNKHYDIIVKLRPDILLKQQFVINIPINENMLVVPQCDSGFMFNDHIAYGSLKSMKIYLTYYEKFKSIDEQNLCDVSMLEYGIKKNLDICNINIIRENINYEIIRDAKENKIIYFGKGKKYYTKIY